MHIKHDEWFIAVTVVVCDLLYCLITDELAVIHDVEWDVFVSWSMENPSNYNKAPYPPCRKYIQDNIHIGVLYTRTLLT